MCLDAIIGSGVVSYFEYLVKAGILPDNPELINHFQVYKKSSDKFLLHNDCFVWADMNKGQAFWPDLMTLTGDVKKKQLELPVTIIGSEEFFNIQHDAIHANRESYPLRPELIDVLMYLVRVTGKEEVYYEMGVDCLETIKRISRLECGFAKVKVVKNHRHENRME